MPERVVVLTHGPARVVRIAQEPARIVRVSSKPVRVLSVAQQGRPGAKGDSGERGLPGSVAGTLPYASITGATYIHTQSTAAAIWQIPHNLGRPLKWTVVDSAGTVGVPGERLVNLNLQHLTFGAPTSGVAYGS